MALRAQANSKGRVRTGSIGGLSGVPGQLFGQVFGFTGLRGGLTNSLKGAVSAGAVLAGGLSFNKALSGAIVGGATFTSALTGGGTLPAVEFSPTKRPAGTTMMRQGRIFGANTITKSNASGLITDSANLSPYTDANGVFRVDGATENIVFHGDSITEGTFSWESYVPKLVRRAYTLKGKVCHYKNRGINGQGLNYAYTSVPRVLQTLTADAPNSVDPAIISGVTNWLVIFAGTNDMALNSTTAAACWTLLQTYINARISAGWSADKIVVVSCLPRGGVDSSTYNTTIASNQASMGFRFVDLRNDARLTSNTNTTYFNTDQIHPTDAGQQAIAEDIQAVMFP